MRKIAASLVVLCLCLGTLLTGCVEAEVPAEGTIEVFISNTIAETDNPTEIEISGIETSISEIKVYRDKVEGGGEWVDLYVATKPLDMLQDSSQNQFLAFMDADDSSTYSRLSLTLEKMDVTLSNGLERAIISEPFEFTGDFAVFGGKTTTILFTFEIDKSVVIEEDSETIKPISEITWKVRYEQPE